MPRPIGSDLSRREAEILQILYRRGQASAAEVQAELTDPPVLSAVRKHLEILERKGRVRHVAEGRRNQWVPLISADRARRSALRQLIRTFFADAPEEVMTTLIDLRKSSLSEASLERIIAAARAAMKDNR